MYNIDKIFFLKQRSWNDKKVTTNFIIKVVKLPSTYIFTLVNEYQKKEKLQRTQIDYARYPYSSPIPMWTNILKSRTFNVRLFVVSAHSFSISLLS